MVINGTEEGAGAGGVAAPLPPPPQETSRINEAAASARDTLTIDRGRCMTDDAGRGESLMERRENPLLADRRRDAMPVQVGTKVVIDPPEDQSDIAARQVLDQIEHTLSSG